MKLMLCKYIMKLLRKAEGNTAYVSWVTQGEMGFSILFLVVNHIPQTFTILSAPFRSIRNHLNTEPHLETCPDCLN